MGDKAFYILIFLLLVSCGQRKKQATFAGGTFSLCLKSSLLHKDPVLINDYTSAQILSQIYEGLVSFHPKDLTVQPQLAKKFEVKDDGLRYEFTLRNDVLFQDFGASLDERKMTAEDVIYSIERACKPDKKGNPSVAYTLVYRNQLKGADAFFKGEAKSISGLSAKGKVVTLQLNRADYGFLDKLGQSSCAIVSKNLRGEDDAFLGTGPFILKKEFESSSNVKLLKNHDYYMSDKAGNALPYLDTLEFRIEGKKLEQLDLFETKKIDLIQGLPTSRITEMLEGRMEDFTAEPPVFYLHNAAILSTDYYFFDMTDKRFQDKRVRQAFNLAIDKQRLGQNVLHNQYYELGIYGVVPPLKNLFRGYDFDNVLKNAYTYDPQKAKQLLAEAGYATGDDFGTVILRFDIDDIHSAVADEFARQIKMNLGITVNIDGSTFERLTKDQETGNGDIFRETWIADYAGPETFLQKFAGKFVPKDSSVPSQFNNSRYINPRFDELFEKAVNSTKLIERRKYFSQAEVELMKDPPIVPLWYSGELCVIYTDVRNFYFNSLSLFDFRQVYIQELTKEEYQKSRNKKS